MQLRAWRTICKNPCDDPPVFITIAPVVETAGIWPWVITERSAIEVFGEEVVAQIGEKPVLVTLALSLLP